MKLNRLETHDRLEYLIKDQEVNIWQGAEGCLKKNSLSLALQEKSPYIYIFAHPRTDENGNKVMYWQPRLVKPEAQTNSYLFRAKSHTDQLEVCWLLPPETMWKQYQKGNVTENEIVMWSIDQYRKNKKKLESPEADDLKDSQVRRIYREIAREQIQEKQNVITPKILEAFPASF